MSLRNLSIFWLFVVFWDAAWMIVARNVYIAPEYLRSTVDVYSVIVYMLGSICLFLCSLLVSVKLKSCTLRKSLIFNWRLLVIISGAFNIYLFVMLADNYRYVDGSFTGGVLLIYYLSMLFNIMVVSSFFMIQASSKVHIGYLLFFLICFTLRIDGLSMALMVFLCYYALLNRRSKNARYYLLVLIPFFGLYGLAEKGDVVVLLQNIFSWVSFRFAIPAETTFHYISGSHFIKNFEGVVAVLENGFNCRFAFIFEKLSSCNGVKSIGNSNYYTLYSMLKGGSSPGYVGAVFILNILIIPLLVAYAWIMGVIFRYIQYRLNFLELLCLFFLFKPLHSNLSDSYSILSGNLGLLVLMGFISLFVKYRY